MNQMLTKDHEYGIHLLASSTTRYYLVAPIKGKNNYELFVLIPDDKTINLPRENFIESISLIEETIKNQNQNQILAIPIIDSNLLKNASTTNDTKPYLHLFNQIREITNDVYKQISSVNSSVSQTVTFIKTNDENTKFIDFIELYVNTNTPGAIQVVNLTSLTKSNDLENTTNETLNVEKPLTKKLTPPKDIPKNAGYANIFLTCITMIVSLILGISIATMIIK